MNYQNSEAIYQVKILNLLHNMFFHVYFGAHIERRGKYSYVQSGCSLRVGYRGVQGAEPPGYFLKPKRDSTVLV